MPKSRRFRKKNVFYEISSRILSYLTDVFYRFKTRIALSLLMSIILSVSFPIIYVVFLLLYTLARTGGEEPVISQLGLYALSPGMYLLEMKSNYKGVYNVFTFIPFMNLIVNMVVFFVLIITVLNLAAYIFGRENLRERLSRMIEVRQDSIADIVRRITK